MSLSGPNGEWLDGVWNLHLLPIGWVVWLADGTTMNSRTDSWDDIPHRVLGVCVYHLRKKRTWMSSVDGYPDPYGIGSIKNGEQVGEDDCQEWLDKEEQMRVEAEE